ncbi:MAG: type IV pilus assembly protein PilM [Acidobacteriota bacterium]
MIFNRSKGVVGLDIGSATVKLVELKERKGGQFTLQRIGVEPLSPEAIVDGSIMDSSLVVDAIQKLNDQTGVKNTSFGTSVSGHSVIIKKIELPAMEPDELAESIQWEAEQHIPFDINDVRLDYVTLSEDDPGLENMEVLLVAVKREKVNDYVSVISQSGKSPALVDVDAFAIQNAYQLNYDLDPLKVVALINMGAGVTNINVIARGQSVFWRDISFGGNQFTEALQREFNLSFDQAELLKRGESVGSYSANDARKVLDAVSAEMANEIQKTFDFFGATSSEGPVDELILSGGCSLTPNLQEVLRERFGVPTELLNPFRRIHFKESDFNREWLDSIAPMLAVSVGLGVRKAGDVDAGDLLTRINLLSEGRRPVVARKTRPKINFGDQDPSLYFLSGGVAAGLLVAGGWWYLLNSNIRGVDTEIRKAEREVAELRPILQEVNDFKAKQRELERKINVINDLTLKQEGPVQIMDRISRALPDLLWLKTMNFRGRTVDLTGTAFNTNAIASFIENLDKVPEFREPDTRDITRGGGGGSYNFRISFRFDQRPPTPPAPEGGVAPEAAAAAAAP